MSAIIFIVETLLSLALFVVLARLLLQWTRADFRNPLCQAVVKITNPMILPLRRVLPPIGKLDTASVVAVLLIATVDVACIFALHALGFPPPLLWVRPVLTEIARTLLWTYLSAIFLYALLSLIAPGGYSPLQSVHATQNPEKKGTFATANGKKRLRKRAHVLFSAPILIARLFGAAFRNDKSSRRSATWRKRVAHRRSRKF